MKLADKIVIIVLLIFSVSSALYVIGCAGCWIWLHIYDGGFHQVLSDSERLSRSNIVSTAKEWLGTTENTERHLQLLEIYNSHKPLARGYVVTTDDNWCATFASAVAIEQNATDIIPTECGCERQIELWKNKDRWTEKDSHFPLPGDYIYYNWNDSWNLNDNTGWADHVGIVVGTTGPLIKVIEGNKENSVCYRIISRFDYRIRGYGPPDYVYKTQ